LRLREEIHRRHLPRDGALAFVAVVPALDDRRPFRLERWRSGARTIAVGELLLAPQTRRGVGEHRPFADRTDGKRVCHLGVIGVSEHALYPGFGFRLSIPASFADQTDVPPTPRALDDDGEFASVLEAAQAGQEWAAARLFTELHPRISRFLCSQASGAGDDLTSEVWLAIAGGLGEFRGDSSGFRAWAFTIARRRLVDHRRRVTRRRTDVAPVETFAVLPARDAPDHEAIELLAGQEAAEFVVSILPPDQAEVILLRVLGDLDAEQVATMMGRSPNWVRVTQHRALRKLADRLGSRIDVMP